MKKLAIISIISVFLLVGCNWFQAPAELPSGEDSVVTEDPVVEDPIIDVDVPEVEDTPEDAAADSESKEVVLAKCLTENGAKLYTASWCGHCKNQKAAFADGLEYLDHTECADGDGWAQACKDADVTSVPTWIFADGTVQEGNTALAKLAGLAGCEY
ncbi:thioredoxin domain-containing protein [Patescibacteria group bacterium]